MTPLATIKVTRQGDALVAALVGEVDLSNASEVAAQVYRAVPNDVTGLVIDLSQTTYLDSRGVHFLLELFERLQVRQQKGRLVLPADSPLQSLFAVLTMSESLGVHPTVQRALDDLRSRT